jgi:hypothetical protein
MAVVVEVAGLALRPRLIKYDDSLHRRSWYQARPSDDQLNIEHLLAQYLLPRRWSELEECQLEKESQARILQWLGQWARPISQLFPFATTRPVAKKPWFCHPLVLRVQGAFVTASSITIDQFLEFLSFVCFVDVFVTFFTGQFNQETGCLEPAPPFNRWFVPGLALQLALNPSMDSVAVFVAKVL